MNAKAIISVMIMQCASMKLEAIVVFATSGLVEMERHVSVSEKILPVKAFL